MCFSQGKAPTHTPSLPCICFSKFTDGYIRCIIDCCTSKYRSYVGMAKNVYTSLHGSLIRWRKSKLLTVRLREKTLRKEGRNRGRRWSLSLFSLSQDRFFNVSDKRGVGRVKGRTDSRYSALRLMSRGGRDDR